MSTTLTSQVCVVSDTDINYIECLLSHITPQTGVSDSINLLDQYISKVFESKLKHYVKSNSPEKGYKRLARRQLRDMFDKVNIQDDVELIKEVWELVYHFSGKLILFIATSRVLLGETEFDALDFELELD